MQPHCAWMSTRTSAIEHGHHWEGAGKNEGPREHQHVCATEGSREGDPATATVRNLLGHLSMAELVATILVLESVGLEV